MRFKCRGSFDDYHDMNRNLGSIKKRISTFSGESRSINLFGIGKKTLFFSYIYRYSKKKRVILAIVEFTDNVIT